MLQFKGATNNFWITLIPMGINTFLSYRTTGNQLEVYSQCFYWEKGEVLQLRKTWPRCWYVCGPGVEDGGGDNTSKCESDCV